MDGNKSYFTDCSRNLKLSSKVKCDLFFNSNKYMGKQERTSSVDQHELSEKDYLDLEPGCYLWNSMRNSLRKWGVQKNIKFSILYANAPNTQWIVQQI